MKNRDDLIAWAWSELDRVTTQASRIDDTSSERYGKAVALVNELLLLTIQPPWPSDSGAAPTTTPARDEPRPGDGSGADAEEPEAPAESTKPATEPHGRSGGCPVSGTGQRLRDGTTAI